VPVPGRGEDCYEVSCAVGLFLSCIPFAAAPLAAKDTTPQFKTIVVRRFTNAPGVSQSQTFINYYLDGLTGELQKIGMANQVAGEGVPVAAADAADSIVIEGMFTSFNKGGFVGKLGLEINIYRISDHALVKTMTTEAAFKHSPFNADQNLGLYTGRQTASLIKQAIKNITLASIPPALPVVNPPALSAGAQTNYSVVEVKHLTKADGVSLSNEYLDSSYDNLRQELAKKGIFGKVVGDGDTIADSDAANVVVLECNITEFRSGFLGPPYVLVDVKLSSRADHREIQRFNSLKIPLNNGGHVPSDEVRKRQ
jgi:hypothetical protein